MLISMQGSWTVSVKSKSAAFPQKFTIIGANTGNGTYTGEVTTAPVNVTGNQWSIGISSDPGTGFQASKTRIKFPQKIGNKYVFDIESNDSGNDTDFDDLVLTCSTTAFLSEYLIYGNVTLYSGPCWINPCFWKWIVIDTYESLLTALEIPQLKEVITELYPERIPPIKVNPNPPDPAPDFKPIMINIVDDVQIPVKQAQIFKPFSEIELKAAGVKTGKKTDEQGDDKHLAHFNVEKMEAAGPNPTRVFKYNKAELARFIEPYRKLICDTDAGANLTLSFEEYDRSVSELAGNPYTGEGDRLPLGNAITDMYGNYIFRFYQSRWERFRELSDYASGENRAVQILPDVIIKVQQFNPGYHLMFETAPYFNIPNLKRVDLCIPKSKVPDSQSFCWNGNLLGSIGNVYLGGSQNKTASFAAAALDRNGFNNHLRANGVVTVNTSHVANPTSVFSVDCACWGGVVDLKGCLFNGATRNNNVPEIHNYTIRYKKSPLDKWEYVTEQMLHPLFHKRFNVLYPGYVGDLVGPFPTSVKEDGGPLKQVPAYINIQREAELLIRDWVPDNIEMIIRLNTNIYQGAQPGRVFFRVDGYDGAGNLVPNATDMIPLYIDNQPLDFGLANVAFPPSIEYVACGLYKMNAAQLNTPLQFKFKAADLLNDPANPSLGFVDAYNLSFGKCPSSLALDMSLPVVRTNITNGILAASPSPVNTDAGGCAGYKGTRTDFGITGYVDVTIQPNAGVGWLTATEEYGVFSLGLTATRRVTNGYNTGIEGTYVNTASFSIIKKA